MSVMYIKQVLAAESQLLSQVCLSCLPYFGDPGIYGEINVNITEL